MNAAAEERTNAAQMNYIADPSASNHAVCFSAQKTLARVAARYADFRTLAVAPEEQALNFAFEPDGTPLVLSRSIIDRSSLAAIVEHLEMASIAALTALSTDSESRLSSGIAPGAFTLDLDAIHGRCPHF